MRASTERRETGMRGYVVLIGVMVAAAGCARSANVEEERANLLAVDRAWSETPKDLDKFLSVVKAIEDFWLCVVKLPSAAEQAA